MKIAVTGATGFVGRHVLRALADRPGVSVVASSRQPIATDMIPSGIRHVPLDIALDYGSAFEMLGSPDVLIHLAWNGLPNYRSHHHFESELPAQYAFIKSLVCSGLSSLLVSGTCYEYGMLSGALSEGMTGEPTNAYALAKIALHRQLLALKVEKPFNLTWARLFYSYGEGQAPSSLLPLLKAAVERGEKRFAMSKGEQLRDYLPIEVIGDNLATLAIKDADPGVVNICSGEPISIRRLVERHRDLHGWNIEFDFGKYPYPDYEPLAFWGDAKKLRGLLMDARLSSVE